MKVPSPKNPPKNVPKSLTNALNKIGAKKIWEVRRTPNRKDDKAFAWVTEKCSGSKCTYKLVRFGSILSETERFDSKDRMRRFRARHGCDTRPTNPTTAHFASCEVTWNKNDPPKTVRNCTNCRKRK